jgi:hypothetical protein
VADAPLERLLRAARALERCGSYLFFRCGARFANPLVTRERIGIAAEPDNLALPVLESVERELVARLPNLPRGIYSPVPIARALAAGGEADRALADFRYEMIEVDADLNWRWSGRPVAPRLRAFFLEHLGYEPEIARHFFEYRVNDGWFDKCYWSGDGTPLVASALTVDEGPEGSEVRVRLNSGERDVLDLSSLRIDAGERLFCRTRRFGEARVSEADRVRLLQGVSDDLRRVTVAGRDWPLRWDAGQG